MTESKVAIIGAGLMGHSIAQLFAAAGARVSLMDSQPESLAAAGPAMARLCQQMEIDEACLSTLTTHHTIADAVSEADLVIEAVPEKIEIKRQVFAAIEADAPGRAILASNTSVIPITRIASAVTDRSRVFGAHFWNPPSFVPLVEVVMTEDSNPALADRLMAILREIGQEPVLVRRDIPGFIGNRLQHAMKREAIALVAAGVCDAETVDQVIKMGFGPRLSVLGTLEQSDLVGLNLTLDIHEELIADLDVTHGPHPYLRALVEKGHLGMKTGQGFYDWTPERSQDVRNRLADFMAERRRLRQQRNQSG
ncbi:hypothetical protein ACO34A_24570 (plasmid) [Rhizobium sp. ACO-34A]|nr:3-hydroxyacyl-CoA dehydrogenase NAD-binding domain-containing protein [Rhizobium sp. ACO-34A]ATN36950.1 hypothetical protein ACO34A_24570 [Rhizobium sp. ACO-34A]